METIYEFVLNPQIDLAEILFEKGRHLRKDESYHFSSSINVSAFHFERMF